MLFTLWLKGILMGLLATAPMGPVGILVVQRTLKYNRQTGFHSGAGAALSDVIYASLAGFGMAVIARIIHENELWFRLAGSAILLILGIFIFLSHPERYATPKIKKRKSSLKYLAGTFMVAFSNPFIVFWHLAVFSAFGVVLSIKQISAAIFILTGFLLGDILWWFLLTWFMDRFRSWFNIKILLWFNRIAGAGIIGFTLIFLIHTFLKEFGV